MNKNKIHKMFFNKDAKKLPKLNEVRATLMPQHPSGLYGFVECVDNYKIRNIYTDVMFPILNEEFIEDLATYLNQNFECTTELMCGTGWLSHWLKKYGCTSLYKSIDNKSWGNFKQWLPLVEDGDAVEYVKGSKEGCFILSWPYMDCNAYKIWENMSSGQTLIYIGEDEGGCTADYDFFKATRGSYQKDISFELNEHFINFGMVYDRIFVFKKW